MDASEPERAIKLIMQDRKGPHQGSFHIEGVPLHRVACILQPLDLLLLSQFQECVNSELCTV